MSALVSTPCASIIVSLIFYVSLAILVSLPLSAGLK